MHITNGTKIVGVFQRWRELFTSHIGEQFTFHQWKYRRKKNHRCILEAKGTVHRLYRWTIPISPIGTPMVCVRLCISEVKGTVHISLIEIPTISVYRCFLKAKRTVHLPYWWCQSKSSKSVAVYWWTVNSKARAINASLTMYTISH